MNQLDIQPIDSLMPAEMAAKAESIGVGKVQMPVMKTLVLAILAGAFIALGAIFMVTVTTGSQVGWGLTRFAGGIAFSLGLILVIIGGAELFTGNNLIIMAWANGKVRTVQVLRNWFWVYLGNTLGAVFIAVLVLCSRQFELADGKVALNLMQIAARKCGLGFGEAFSLGILCNILVCLAVWLSFSVRSTSGRILAILFPISAFVTCGFEHSIANLFFVPLAIGLKSVSDPALLASFQQAGLDLGVVNWISFLVSNLLPVTLGNIVGGAGFVGLVYWFVYLRKGAKGG